MMCLRSTRVISMAPKVIRVTRFISSNNSSKKDLDDKIINDWKEGIQKREELKKTFAAKERNDFIEAKKKQLAESLENSEKLKKAVHEEKASHLEPESKAHETFKSEGELKVSGSYQQLVKKIKENENLQQLKEELKKYNEAPQEKKSVREELAQRLQHNAQELKNAFPIVLRIVNDLTGYTKVEALKKDISEKENAKNELKAALAAAKAKYNKSIELRSMSQKQVNELLQRQNSWSLEDLEKFTELYKNDHTLEKQEQHNLQQLEELEAKKDENDEKLITSILTRYHEEQVWSDKIRKFSTWGTILIMAVNLFLFVMVQLVFEPFKRRRLVNAFEAKVKELLEVQNGAVPAILTESVQAEKALLNEISEMEKVIAPTEKPPTNDVIQFAVPQFEKSNIWKFCGALSANIKNNLQKIFWSGSTVLLIDRLQLNILLGVSFILSFTFGFII